MTHGHARTQRVFAFLHVVNERVKRVRLFLLLGVVYYRGRFKWFRFCGHFGSGGDFLAGRNFLAGWYFNVINHCVTYGARGNRQARRQG
jgi:hypothetical protein